MLVAALSNVAVYVLVRIIMRDSNTLVPGNEAPLSVHVPVCQNCQCCKCPGISNSRFYYKVSLSSSQCFLCTIVCAVLFAFFSNGAGKWIENK